MTTACMLCQKTGKMCYNLFTDYENTNHTVKDDLIEIFGVDVESYLTSTDYVCGVCMVILENIAKLKRRLWPLICHAHTHQNCKPIKMGRIWDILASLKFEEEDGEEENHAAACRTPSPSKLLAVKYSKAYNERLENKIANIERCRSLSRASSTFGRSDASETSEVRRIFSRKRKKRNSRKNWTHQKRRGRSRSRPATYNDVSPSRQSDWDHSYTQDYDRSHSRVSNGSFASSYSPKKSSGRSVKYDEQGRLIGKRTRSVSRAQEEEARHLDSSKFYCLEKECSLYFRDMDALNHHCIIHHHMLPLYICDECSMKYITSQHLKLHKKTHDKYPFLCPLCACDISNQEALQEHLEEHMTYSVPCNYCDKSFLSVEACENHCIFSHKGRRERIIHKEEIIIHRIDKDEKSKVKNSVTNSSVAQSSSSDKYSVHYLRYTDMEHNQDDLEVTEENFKRMGLDFIIDNDEDSSSDESELLDRPPSQNIVDGGDLLPSCTSPSQNNVQNGDFLTSINSPLQNNVEISDLTSSSSPSQDLESSGFLTSNSPLQNNLGKDVLMTSSPSQNNLENGDLQTSSCSGEGDV